ncbi:hypothetical protein K470DRAFT_265091 [Piedraia hortae CBS 480.64]|uniref:Uncharacterized protein n=1 Tax=Piedraia hortae CBS 480.64 TaxID=1314780 RepID=A0A6A7BY84_9PEZI|nr:hypothetical protein K470DRAFT_265091 [Piedraia hortae CBS 480.64]
MAEKLFLRTLKYWGENIPDWLFDLVPGHYYKPKDKSYRRESHGKYSRRHGRDHHRGSRDYYDDYDDKYDDDFDNAYDDHRRHHRRRWSENDVRAYRPRDDDSNKQGHRYSYVEDYDSDDEDKYDKGHATDRRVDSPAPVYREMNHSSRDERSTSILKDSKDGYHELRSSHRRERVYSPRGKDDYDKYSTGKAKHHCHHHRKHHDDYYDDYYRGHRHGRDDKDDRYYKPRRSGEYRSVHYQGKNPPNPVYVPSYHNGPEWADPRESRR